MSQFPLLLFFVWRSLSTTLSGRHLKKRWPSKRGVGGGDACAATASILLGRFPSVDFRHVK
jgi:4-diphosphocytidyl-2C-methyl-D-erythritol kinase